MQVTLDVTVDATADAGAVAFRVQTPLGTTPEGRIAIEPPFEVTEDREPNDSVSSAMPFKPASILAGTIAKAGDIDLYKLTVAAGQELSFENVAALTGSTLQPIISIINEDGAVEQEYASASGFRHKFTSGGTRYVRISDFLQSGRNTHFYRIRVSSDRLPAPKSTMTWAADLSSGDSHVSSAGTNSSRAAARRRWIRCST
jgi:hypothetical protein